MIPVRKYAFFAFAVSALLVVSIAQRDGCAAELWRQYLSGLKAASNSLDYSHKWPIAERYGYGCLEELEKNMKSGKRVGITDSELRDFVSDCLMVLVDKRIKELDKVYNENQKYYDQSVHEGSEMAKKQIAMLKLESQNLDTVSQQLEILKSSANHEDKVNRIKELSKNYAEPNQSLQQDSITSTSEWAAFSAKSRINHDLIDSKESAAQTADLKTNVDLSGRILRVCQYYATNPTNWYQSKALEGARDKYQYESTGLDLWKKTTGSFHQRFTQYNDALQKYRHSLRDLRRLRRSSVSAP